MINSLNDSLPFSRLIDALLDNNLSASGLNGLDGVSEKKLISGQMLFKAGTDAECVYFIQSGIVKVIDFLPEGKGRTLRLHARGDFIGLEGLIENHYQHWAVVVLDTKVTAIPVELIKALEDSDLHEYCALLKLFQRHLAMADKWISEFSTGSIKARIARFIEFLSNFEQQGGQNQVELLKVQEVSEILGVTPESASRVMAEFKRKNILIEDSNTKHDQYWVDQKKLDDEMF